VNDGAARLGHQCAQTRFTACGTRRARPASLSGLIGYVRDFSRASAIRDPPAQDARGRPKAASELGWWACIRREGFQRRWGCFARVLDDSRAFKFFGVEAGAGMGLERSCIGRLDSAGAGPGGCTDKPPTIC